MWKDGPQPEPRNRGILTEDDLRQYGLINENPQPMQDNVIFDEEIHEAIPMEAFEAMSGMPEETEVAPADNVVIVEENDED